MLLPNGTDYTECHETKIFKYPPSLTFRQTATGSTEIYQGSTAGRCRRSRRYW